MTTEFFKITTPAGEVIFEPRGAVAPGERARTAIAEYGVGTKVGITTAGAPEARKAVGGKVEVGHTVEFRAYGKRYAGKVVKVTPTYVHVEYVVVGTGGTRVRPFKSEHVTVVA